MVHVCVVASKEPGQNEFWSSKEADSVYWSDSETVRG